MTYSLCLSFPCQVPDVISLLLLQPPSRHLHEIGKSLQQSQCCWLPGSTAMAQWEHPTELCSTAPSSHTLRTLPTSATPCDLLHWENVHPLTALLHQNSTFFNFCTGLGLGFPPTLWNYTVRNADLRLQLMQEMSNAHSGVSHCPPGNTAPKWVSIGKGPFPSHYPC